MILSNRFAMDINLCYTPIHMMCGRFHLETWDWPQLLATTPTIFSCLFFAAQRKGIEPRSAYASTSAPFSAANTAKPASALRRVTNGYKSMLLPQDNRVQYGKSRQQSSSVSLRKKRKQAWGSQFVRERQWQEALIVGASSPRNNSQ